MSSTVSSASLASSVFHNCSLAPLDPARVGSEDEFRAIASSGIIPEFEGTSVGKRCLRLRPRSVGSHGSGSGTAPPLVRLSIDIGSGSHVAYSFSQSGFFPINRLPLRSERFDRRCQLGCCRACSDPDYEDWNERSSMNGNAR